jgi:translation initiation factor IF-3
VFDVWLSYSRISEGQGLDLVPVALNADPVVCRIMDYHRTQYEKKKKKKLSRKKTAQLKEIKFRPDIAVILNNFCCF